MPTILFLLICSCAAAACAALAVVPLSARDRVPTTWIGWSNALAAGVMLGTAYVLTVSDALVLGGRPAPWIGALGALAGILFIRWTHSVLRASELDLNRVDDIDPVYGFRVFLIATLHSASEGVAIGVAMAVDVRLGVVMAVAIALHNIPEALGLGAVLRQLGLKLKEVAGVVTAARLNQVLLSVVAFAVAQEVPGTLP